MARLEDLKPDVVVRGIIPDTPVTVISTRWFGEVVELTYREPSGQPGTQLLYRSQQDQLEIAEDALPWRFDGDGELLRLVSEAYRIRLAYLFDPLLAVHTSLVDPLPHQITAVYEEMLSRQPLRFLLADDPGAGKTIMTGLFIKELIMRGDLTRCLIVCPGSLVEQWQDELDRKFHLPFTIVTRQTIEASHSGNPFAEHNLVIARLDHLSRNPDVQARLEQTDWDLIVVDEAHKMSASFWGGEVKETQRYRLGKLLSGLARHFLLLTATPHNGRETDFQLFMALLDADRFEGRFRDGVHETDASDLMRRMVKEQLVKFDGTPLFPERIAYTVGYHLSPLEAELYREVTRYVAEEMNRAERLERDGEMRRGGTVGFALTILQRRLASSPEAILQSLRRRRERLEKRLLAEEDARRSPHEVVDASALETDPLQTIRESNIPYLSDEDLDDLDDAPDAEVERLESAVADRATAARTITELRKEIDSLGTLEALARRVRESGTDRKWDELSHLLGDVIGRRKLIIFTEHRDTLSYLQQRIGTYIGRPDTVVTIHGGMNRDQRRAAQEAFAHDPDVQILLATDAAGEGVNLQQAHLMVNYDLPWNPNRIEQRFGRIHRIGQTEVCHLWNLVAIDTREGDVFARLFQKLEEERTSLGGKVFDVLGKVFSEHRLRDLLIEAIRYGDRPEVRQKLTREVDHAFDREHLVDLLEERALARDTMDARRLMRIREDMERAEARRLQPFFIQRFFLEAFRRLGGTIHARERDRFEVTRVPGVIRHHEHRGAGDPILPRYQRITFEKSAITVPGKPVAAFICPGHPLLDATIDVILERYRDLLRCGAVLVDPTDPPTEVRALVYLEHAIQDGRTDRVGNRRTISRRLEFVELLPDGMARSGGYAPYLDYRPITDEERVAVAGDLYDRTAAGLEGRAMAYAIENLIPEHLQEVRDRREEMVKTVSAAVRERLTKEISYWDRRAEELREQELAGKQPKMNSSRARERVESLTHRLARRERELELERQVAALPPVVVGAALVMPAGLLAQRLPGYPTDADALDRKRIEILAMDAVMAAERRLGRKPRDVSAERCGYDIESTIDGEKPVMIEVKGRTQGADTVTLTANEILTALNKPDSFVLALVEVDGTASEPRYLRKPPFTGLGFAEESRTFDLAKLLGLAGEPS